MELIDEENLYIKISKFGRNHPGGFSYDDLAKEFELADGKWEDNMIKSYLQKAVDSGKRIGNNTLAGINFTFIPNLDSMFFAIENTENILTSKFILKYDAYFNYMNYLELKAVNEQSQKSEEHAQKAEHVAMWAIYIAAITLVASIIFSIWQIFSPVKLDSKQFHKIINNIQYRTLQNSIFDK